MRRSHPPRACAAALALLGALATPGCGAPTDAPAPPNVVLVTLDTLRADHLGLYGYFRDTSPNLDRLAAESIVFERCLAPAAVTLPSHLSLLTATHPLEHGVFGNLAHGARSFAVSPRLRSFAEFLGEQGYARAAFVSAAPLKQWSGIQRGFDPYDVPSGRTRRADETTTRAIAWLARPAPEPFLLWIHYFDPHHPYEPPPGFAERFAADAAAAERHLAELRVPLLAHTTRGDPVHTREALDAYDGEVLFTDREIGRLLEALRARDLLERSALVVVGDHGEGLGQHGVTWHGGVWDEHLRVPLLMRVPGQAPRRVEALASIEDVLPTLLAMLEIPSAEEFLAQASGVDALAAGTGERSLLAQSSLRVEREGHERSYALTTRRWKLIAAPGDEPQLYDHERDPHELEGVADAHPDVVRALAAELERRVAELERRGRGLRSESQPPLDPAAVEELRALGYVEEE
jgi:arylsulfatase A-like enzyme